VLDTAPIKLGIPFFINNTYRKAIKETRHKIINLLNTNYQHKGKTIKAAVAAAVSELWGSSSN